MWRKGQEQLDQMLRVPCSHNTKGHLFFPSNEESGSTNEVPAHRMGEKGEKEGLVSASLAAGQWEVDNTGP